MKNYSKWRQKTYRGKKIEQWEKNKIWSIRISHYSYELFTLASSRNKQTALALLILLFFYHANYWLFRSCSLARACTRQTSSFCRLFCRTKQTRHKNTTTNALSHTHMYTFTHTHVKRVAFVLNEHSIPVPFIPGYSGRFILPASRWKKVTLLFFRPAVVRVLCFYALHSPYLKTAVFSHLFQHTTLSVKILSAISV